MSPWFGGGRRIFPRECVRFKGGPGCRLAPAGPARHTRGMDPEGESYRETDGLPDWSDSPTARLLMIAGAVVVGLVALGLLG